MRDHKYADGRRLVIKMHDSVDDAFEINEYYVNGRLASNLFIPSKSSEHPYNTEKSVNEFISDKIELNTSLFLHLLIDTDILFYTSLKNE